MQADQHCLAPLQQGGALALALSGNVLPQGEQAIRLVIARAAVDVAHEGAAHLLNGQIKQITDVLGGDGRGHAVKIAGAQTGRDFVFQNAGAGHHQMDRNMHARMHFAHLFLRGHQRDDIALIAHTEQALQPILHAVVQARRNDLVRQTRPGLNIRQQGGIEGVHQFFGAIAHYRCDLAARVGVNRLIDRFPGLRV
ncbi:Uncharacterised protein [Achromobacter kerstersii]|nr:Uncharacterised protein [Achromobacter kerstersii]